MSQFGDTLGALGRAIGSGNYGNIYADIASGKAQRQQQQQNMAATNATYRYMQSQGAPQDILDLFEANPQMGATIYKEWLAKRDAANAPAMIVHKWEGDNGWMMGQDSRGRIMRLSEFAKQSGQPAPQMPQRQPTQEMPMNVAPQSPPLTDAPQQSVQGQPMPAQQPAAPPVQQQDPMAQYSPKKRAEIQAAQQKQFIENFKNERSLADEFIKREPIKSFEEIRDAYEKVRISAQKGNSAGDIGLVYGYMKMLDPGSVVREGEFATAEQVGGAAQKYRNLYNNLVRGERLNNDQRRQLAELAGAHYNASRQNAETVVKHYQELAETYKMSPDNVTGGVDLEKYEPLELGEKEKNKPMQFNQKNDVPFTVPGAEEAYKKYENL